MVFPFSLNLGAGVFGALTSEADDFQKPERGSIFRHHAGKHAVQERSVKAMFKTFATASLA